MGNYHQARLALKSRIEDALRRNVGGKGRQPSGDLDQTIDAKSEQLLNEFEELVVSRHVYTTGKYMNSYLIGVSQSVVAAVVFALLLWGWYYVEIGSHQDPVQLARKTLEKTVSPTPTQSP